MHFPQIGTGRLASASLTAASLVALGAALAACGGSDVEVEGDSTVPAGAATTTADSAAAAASTAGTLPTVPREGETTGFSTPESVKYDPQQDVYFVTNIDGNPSAKDNKAFIVKVEAGNIGAFTKFVEAGINGVELNAPKGMAIVGDTLWVADIDVVRGFQRYTGQPVATVEVPNAVFLNDIAADPSSGALYVTDTGIRFGADGSVSQPGPGRIYKIAGGKATVAASGPSLARPNGITWDVKNSGFVVAPFGGKTIGTWREGDASPTRLADGPGEFDGIEEHPDGRLFVSSWADSSVYMFDAGMLHKVVSGVDAPADIGIDTKRNRLIVPRFNKNTIEYYPIEGLKQRMVPPPTPAGPGGQRPQKS